MEIKEKILEVLQEKFVKHKNLNDLSSKLSKMLNYDQEEVLLALKDLESDGDIFPYTRSRYATSKMLGLVKGKVSLKDRFAFVLCDGGDVFVAKKNILGAYDGDYVLCKVLSTGKGGKKREGKIVKILQRDSDDLTGTFVERKDGLYIIPDKKSLEVVVKRDDTLGAKDGDKVVFDIISYRASTPIARIKEVIGNIFTPGNDIKWLLRQYKVKEHFDENTLEQSKAISQEVPQEKYKNRVDLRDDTIFTIDGEDAKDLDDGVSIKKNKDGTYLLGVHIADVGEYVTLGCPIDEEAFMRGTSIYFLDKVIPMLPKELSNGICSLNENVDRLALSVEMNIDKNGDVLDSKIFESVIRSKHRLSYNQVMRVLDGDKKEQQNLKDIKDDLFSMLELSQILDNRRKALGSLDFDLPEGEVIVDGQGRPVEIVKRRATKATKIIETFMVVANEVVAKQFDRLKIPFVYRIHEKPDPDKMSTFFRLAKLFGVNIKAHKKEVEPKDLQEVLHQVDNSPAEEVINMIMLRSLKKAKYFDKCMGHFGMSLNYYCHFTSPIRRYPDLTIHRIIKEYLHGNNSFIKSEKMANFVIKSAERSSIQEKLSEDVERAITDYKKCEYMSQFIGKEFDGIVSGVSNRGMYVELDNTCEGLVAIRNMKDDFYFFDEENMSLYSESGKYYRIGEKVRVKLVQTSPANRQIDFELVKKLK